MTIHSEIRLAIPEDAMGIARLVANGGADAHYSPLHGVDEQYIEACRNKELSLDGIVKWYDRIAQQAPERHILIATNALRKVVGMHYSRIKDGERGSIIGCYVDPEYRGGGTTGTAQRLTDAALDWLGNRTIDVMIATYNEPSQRFHRRNGFVEPGARQMMGRVPTQLWYRRPQPGEWL